MNGKMNNQNTDLTVLFLKLIKGQIEDIERAYDVACPDDMDTDHRDYVETQFQEILDTLHRVYKILPNSDELETIFVAAQKINVEDLIRTSDVYIGICDLLIAKQLASVAVNHEIDDICKDVVKETTKYNEAIALLTPVLSAVELEEKEKEVKF